jgi:transaldolase
MFVSRWDVAVAKQVPERLRNRLGICIAQRTYRAYCELLSAPRWQRLGAAGAHPQRLLWASTGSKDPDASDVLYVEALAAPQTINTVPEATLLAFAEHGTTGSVMPVDGGDADAVLADFVRQGIDAEALAARLQLEGTAAFAKSWDELLGRIGAKGAALVTVKQA